MRFGKKLLAALMICVCMTANVLPAMAATQNVDGAAYAGPTAEDYAQLDAMVQTEAQKSGKTLTRVAAPRAERLCYTDYYNSGSGSKPSLFIHGSKTDHTNTTIYFWSWPQQEWVLVPVYHGTTSQQDWGIAMNNAWESGGWWIYHIGSSWIAFGAEYGAEMWNNDNFWVVYTA